MEKSQAFEGDTTMLLPAVLYHPTLGPGDPERRAELSSGWDLLSSVSNQGEWCE